MQTRFDEWDVAVGIDWTMPSNTGEARAEKKKKERVGQSSVLMRSDAGQRWLGFHAAVQGKVYAAGPLVGMVKADAVVYQPIGESDAWVCAIQDGMPAPGFDKVLSAAEARNLALEWSSMFSNAVMIGDLEGAWKSIGDVFKVLDDALADKAIQRKQIAVALLSNGGMPVAKIAGFASVLILAGGLSYGVTWYLDVRQAQEDQKLSFEQAARVAMASAQSEAELVAQRQAAVASFKSQVDAAREANGARYSPASLWNALGDVRRKVPYSTRGFRPQSFDCSVSACRVTWLGAGRLVSAADKLHLPNVERRLTDDLTATSVFPVTPVQDQLPAINVASADELRFLIQSALSLHVKGVTTEPAQAQTIPAPPGAGVGPAVVAEVGKWRVQVQGTTALLDTPALLAIAAKLPMRVTAIKYQPGPGSVDLEGEFVFIPDQKD